MDRLFNSVSRLLDSKIKLVQYTALSQNQINQVDIILWNKEAVNISSELYIDLKNAFSKRPCKYYLCSSILPFSEFCIAIVCCLQYRLNHTTTKNIPEITYRAAWRIIDSQSSIGKENIKQWINTYIKGRTSKGYCTALDISLEKSTRFISFNKEVKIHNREEDEIISTISRKPKITRINKIDNLTTSIDKILIFESTYTPQGQLYDLQNAYFLFQNCKL